jgi:hypothetical protein
MIAGALSSQASSAEPLTTREAVFDKPGEHWWERPKDVRFVRIQTCGGGGGGGGGIVLWPYLRDGGGGGAGSEVHDVIVGPLNAARYQIFIGNGGKGGATLTRNGAGEGKGEAGKPGHESSFKGEDASFVAVGGEGGDEAAGKVVSSSLGTGAIPDPATRTGTFRQTFGGGKHEPGGSSPYAKGGMSNDKLSAGGGGAGLKQGGDAGGANGGGGPGGLCAGGGGAGAPSAAGLITTGGDGGSGYLMLVPLVSTDAVEARVKKLLDMVAEGAKNP